MLRRDSPAPERKQDRESRTDAEMTLMKSCLLTEVTGVPPLGHFRLSCFSGHWRQAFAKDGVASRSADTGGVAILPRRDVSQRAYQTRLGMGRDSDRAF
jgi:hypothetical protein